MAFAASFSNSSFRDRVVQALEDPASIELMKNAVTLVPCGHDLNQDTVIQILARDRLCPVCRTPIREHIPNYTIRALASHIDDPLENAPTEEAERSFAKGKELADQGKKEEAVEAILEALKISPTYEKAQSYLECYLGISRQEPSSRPPNQTPKDQYTDLLLRLLDHQLVQENPVLFGILEDQLEQLMEQETVVLTQPQKEMFTWMQKIFVDTKISQFVVQKLRKLQQQTPLVVKKAAEPRQEIDVDTLTRAVQKAEAEKEAKEFIKTRSFGEVQWRKFFGGVGVIPSLPSNIKEIMTSPCPFWPGKTVEETHMLVLIPQTIGGKPFTLKTLVELVQKPREGHAMKYGSFETGDYIDISVENSRWSLVTRNPIPGCEGKPYAEQQAKLAKHCEEAEVFYDVANVLDVAVSIFMERYLAGVAFLYASNVSTTTSNYSTYWGFSGTSGYSVTRWQRNYLQQIYIWCREKYNDKEQLCVVILADGSVSIGTQQLGINAAEALAKPGAIAYTTAKAQFTQAYSHYEKSRPPIGEYSFKCDHLQLQLIDAYEANEANQKMACASIGIRAQRIF